MLKNLEEALLGALPIIGVGMKGVVLFGSSVRGDLSEDSDIDLLVVMEPLGRNRRHRRETYVRIKQALNLSRPLDLLLYEKGECRYNFQNHNPLFLDIATEGIVLYDPEGFLKNEIEITRKYITRKGLVKQEDGWDFPVDYRKVSNLSKISNRDFVIAWLTDSQRDLESARKLHDASLCEKSIYHCQQAVEKASKAVLLCWGTYRKTHFTAGILRAEVVRQKMPESLRNDLNRISEYAELLEPEVSLARYPGMHEGGLWVPSEEYGEEDSSDAIGKAEEVLKIADKFVKWWFKS